MTRKWIINRRRFVCSCRNTHCTHVSVASMPLLLFVDQINGFLLFIIIFFLDIFTYTFLKVNPNPILCDESTLCGVPGSHTLIWWLSFFMTQLTKSRDRSYKPERCAHTSAHIYQWSAHIPAFEICFSLIRLLIWLFNSFFRFVFVIAGARLYSSLI